MHIVKLGGSLYGSDELTQWLEKLKQRSLNDCIVIVPGGGPFADKVRQAQHDYGFGDKTAHHMAILSMKQYGLMLIELANARPYHYPQAQPELAERGLFVWLPDDQLLNIEQLSPSWEMTSDSIALWLGQQVNVSTLSIIKSSDDLDSNLHSLSQLGIIDSGFSALFAHKPIPTRLFNRSQFKQFPNNGIAII